MRVKIRVFDILFKKEKINVNPNVKYIVLQDFNSYRVEKRLDDGNFYICMIDNVYWHSEPPMLKTLNDVLQPLVAIKNELYSSNLHRSRRVDNKPTLLYSDEEYENFTLLQELDR